MGKNPVVLESNKVSVYTRSFSLSLALSVERAGEQWWLSSNEHLAPSLVSAHISC